MPFNFLYVFTFFYAISAVIGGAFLLYLRLTEVDFTVLPRVTPNVYAISRRPGDGGSGHDDSNNLAA